MSSKAELACVYASLILRDDDVAITGDKISTILKAAGVTVEPYWPSLFAKALEGVDVKSLLSNVGAGVGAAPAASPSVAAPVSGGGDAKPAAEEKAKKEEPAEESDDDMGFGLFD